MGREGRERTGEWGGREGRVRREGRESEEGGMGEWGGREGGTGE